MLTSRVMDSNATLQIPEWFVEDKGAGVAEAEILNKLKAELYHEVVNRQFNMYLWTDKFIEEVAEIYMDHFNKIYVAAL